MNRASRVLLRAGVVAACVVASAVPAFAQDRVILTGASVVKPDGSIAPNSAVIISGGKIEKVVPADQAGATAKDTVVKLDAYPGAVISPGLIDLRSMAGALGSTVERKQSIDPSISAVDAIDPRDPTLARALRAGITTVMVTPAENNVVCGVAATVHTWSADLRLDVLRSDGPMVFSFGTAPLSPERDPSSRAGALSLLRDALSTAKAGKGSDRLAKVVNKQLDVLAVCEDGEDVDNAIRTFSEYSITPNIAATDDATETARDLAGAQLVTVLGPFTFTSSTKSLMSASAFAAGNVEVAFSARTPVIEGAGLRLTASLATRYGLDPAAARRGLTRNAAKVAGVLDRVGALEPGKDADVVVFSADPLRLDARVISVYVKGVRAYAAPTSRGNGMNSGTGSGGDDWSTGDDTTGGSP